MNELKTYRDIIKALSEGYEVECLSWVSGNWETIVRLNLELVDLDEKLGTQYRAKMTKPSINWSQVREDYNYLVRNSDGQALLYQSKPDLYEYMWYTHLGECSSASSYKSYKPGTCDWKESLVERHKELME